MYCERYDARSRPEEPRVTLDWAMHSTSGKEGNVVTWSCTHWCTKSSVLRRYDEIAKMPVQCSGCMSGQRIDAWKELVFISGHNTSRTTRRRAFITDEATKRFLALFRHRSPLCASLAFPARCRDTERMFCVDRIGCAAHRGL